MTTNTTAPVEGLEATDIVATSKHWGVLLTFGILTAGLGAVIIAWPGKTVAVAAVLLGIALLISGIFSLVGSFTQPDQSTGSRVLMAMSGVLSIALAFIAFQGITQAVALLVIIVGIGWLVRGIMELIAGIQAKGVPGRSFVIAGGVIAILAGAAVLVWPSITLTVLCWIFGLTLVLMGLLQIVASFELRSAGKRAAEAAPVVAAEAVTVGEVVTD